MRTARDEDVWDEDYEPVQKRKRRGPLFVLGMLCILVLIVPLIIGGFYAGRSFQALDSIERDAKLTPVDYVGRPPAPSPKPPPAPGEPEVAPPVHFVLMGSDSRGDEGGRSDSLMVAHVSGDRQHVYLISFPRDMWVDIPGRGKGKINWAYSFGGAQLTVRTLEQLLGVRMDHTVAIDFEGFMALTDAVGGVTVYNPWTTEQNEGMRFEKGEIQLEGERALAYVRERYQLPNGDLDRAHRQRTVLKAIIRKIMTPKTLANPVSFSNVAGRIANTLTVDDAMTNGYVTDLGMSMRITGSDSVRLLQAPILGFGKVRSQSVDVVDYDGVAELATAMKDDTMADYFAKHQGDPLEALGEVDPPQ